MHDHFIGMLLRLVSDMSIFVTASRPYRRQNFPSFLPIRPTSCTENMAEESWEATSST